MSATKPTLAFFGATGGCANNALALALKDDYKVSARMFPIRVQQQILTIL